MLKRIVTGAILIPIVVLVVYWAPSWVVAIVAAAVALLATMAATVATSHEGPQYTTTTTIGIRIAAVAMRFSTAPLSQWKEKSKRKSCAAVSSSSAVLSVALRVRRSQATIAALALLEIYEGFEQPRA